jgi:hypothetical protein
MVKAIRRPMFLAEALKQRIFEVGGNTALAMERIKADMDAHRLNVTWEDRDGATHTNVLPAGCAAWADATIDWSRSTAMWWREPEVRLVPQLEYIERHITAFCVRVRAAQKPPTTAAAEKRCGEWLNEMMRASPTARPKLRQELRAEADSLFGVSGRAFDRVWRNGIKTTGATWNRPGAPKKS